MAQTIEKRVADLERKLKQLTSILSGSNVSVIKFNTYGVISSNETVKDIISLTEAEYLALSTPDPETLYVII